MNNSRMPLFYTNQLDADGGALFLHFENIRLNMNTRMISTIFYLEKHLLATLLRQLKLQPAQV